MMGSPVWIKSARQVCPGWTCAQIEQLKHNGMVAGCDSLGVSRLRAAS